MAKGSVKASFTPCRHHSKQQYYNLFPLNIHDLFGSYIRFLELDLPWIEGPVWLFIYCLLSGVILGPTCIYGSNYSSNGSSNHLSCGHQIIELSTLLHLAGTLGHKLLAYLFNRLCYEKSAHQGVKPLLKSRIFKPKSQKFTKVQIDCVQVIGIGGPEPKLFFVWR